MPECNICKTDHTRLKAVPIAMLNPMILPAGIKIKVCTNCFTNIKIGAMIFKQIRQRFPSENKFPYPNF